MTEALQLAALIAQILPSLITVYDKIVQNNQDAGLVPADQLIAEGRSNAAATLSAAQSEVDKLS